MAPTPKRGAEIAGKRRDGGARAALLPPLPRSCRPGRRGQQRSGTGRGGSVLARRHHAAADEQRATGVEAARLFPHSIRLRRRAVVLALRGAAPGAGWISRRETGGARLATTRK